MSLGGDLMRFLDRLCPFRRLLLQGNCVVLSMPLVTTGRWVTAVGVWYFHIKKSALSQPLSIIIHLKSIKESFIWTWFELCVETYSRRFYIWTNSKMMSCRLNLVLVDIRFENLFNQCFCPILLLWWVVQWPWTNFGFPMLSRKTILGSEKMDNVAWADCEAHYS